MNVTVDDQLLAIAWPSDAESRHLQGSYADRDGLRSTLTVLSRESPRR